MTRESGWYRVNVAWTVNVIIMEWDSHLSRWFATGTYHNACYEDGDMVQCHDPQMVMTPNGEIVYHTSQHDPLYNTAQEQ